MNSTSMSLNACIIIILGFGSVCFSNDFSSCSSFQLKTTHFNKYLNGHSFAETGSPNHPECAKMCMSFSICKSFDYYSPKQNCTLNNADSSSVQDHEFTHLAGAIFSDISDWPNVMVGSCGKRPCAPNKMCVPNLGDPDGYDCIDSGLINIDCKDVLRNNPDAKTGQYNIFLLESKKELSVYCDMDTDRGGWTVFQRRINNETDFYRDYSEHENGFGTVSKEFWLGLKNIKELANQGVTELRVDMAPFYGTEGYESFQDFKLVQPGYTLHLGAHAANSKYKGVGGMLYNNGADFSTYDHDVSESDCASGYRGAWWYRNCSHVFLNRVISPSKPCMRHTGWTLACLKSASMKLRRTTSRKRN